MTRRTEDDPYTLTKDDTRRTEDHPYTLTMAFL